MEEENRPEFSSPVEPEVEPFQIDYAASVPDTVAPVEQRCKQQEESNKDNVTELILRWPGMRRLAITSDKEEGNGHHERDDELRTDEDSQCNLHRAAIFSATDSNKDGSDEAQEWGLTGVDLEDDAGV